MGLNKVKVGDIVNGWKIVSSPELKTVNNSRRRTFVHAQCSCGVIKEMPLTKIKTGNTKSCGCKKVSPPANQKHGLSKTRVYRIYHKMLQRCYNKKNDNYHHYGGRGITVCNEWRSDFISFYKWAISNGYSNKLSIDRIDNDKGYSPINCRWVSQAVQARNTRRSRKVKINGAVKNLKDWAEHYCIDFTTVRHRVERGYSYEKALTESPFQSLRVKVKSTTTGEIWSSCKDCALGLGVSNALISKHFNGKIKTVKGHKLVKL